MDALELLKTVISQLRVMQFDPTQRSAGEVDGGYRNGHNDGIRTAIKVCESHRAVAFACTRGCGWKATAAGKEVDKLMLRYGCCPACKQKDGTHTPVEMAEVVL